MIIDGANVAFWGQSFEQGQFQFSQIGDVVETICAEMADQKPLVVSLAISCSSSCQLMTFRVMSMLLCLCYAWAYAKLGVG